MGSLKDTKRRIGSVKNTQKITRAMKLVSAAKFARANQGAVDSRPYADAFERMVTRLSSVVEVESPLTKVRPVKRVLAVVMTSDKGLCGGLNSNIIKKATFELASLKDTDATVDVVVWGRRGGVVAQKLGLNIASKAEKVLEKPSYKLASEASSHMITEFSDEKYDKVVAFYPRFENAMTQVAEMVQLLPIEPLKSDSTTGQVHDDKIYVFEPNAETLLNHLLERQVSLKLFRMMLEGSASEHAARMTAMDNATNNAEEVIKKLTLDYNRARQAAITTELIEITSGAEAL